MRHMICYKICFYNNPKLNKVLTRRGSEIRITDSGETLAQVFEYRNMKKAAILDPNAQKN